MSDNAEFEGYTEENKKQLFRELTAGMTRQWEVAHECATKQPSAEFPYQFKKIEINGHNIAYVDEGEGDPILFIHGAPSSSYLWRNIMPWVEDRARVISIDLLGFGQSDKPDIEYGYFQHSEYVRKFIEALDLKNITLVLHDWGFNYGMEYACDHEDNIKGICMAENLMWPRYPIVDTDQYESQRPGTLRMYKIMQSSLGEEIVLDHNLFLECVVIEHIYRRMNQEAFQYWREPLMDPICRKANLQMPRDVPINGKPEKIVASYDKYNNWFTDPNKSVPSLCVYGTPGAVTIESDVEWQQENIEEHETLWVGPGIHFLQEENPESWGRGLRDWYGRITKAQKKKAR
jgi:haloalkane dehalogenase